MPTSQHCPPRNRPPLIASFLILAMGSTFANFITNGSFEAPLYSGITHTAPDNWTVGGPANRGGLHSDNTRASESSQYITMGGWTDDVGMQLSQTVDLTEGTAYQLNFDAGINHGTGAGNLLIEVFGGGNTPLRREVTLQSTEGMTEIQLQFLATSSQMTVRFTHTQGDPGTDLDLDHVRLVSAPLYQAQNGILMIEAEDADPVGDWREVPVDGATGLLFDPTQSSESTPPVGQSLSYIFRTNEAASYHFALKSGRITSVIEEGFDIAYGDTGNNDTWFSLYNARTNAVIQNPIRHLTGNWNNSNGWLKWGNLFSNGTSRLNLDANTEYRLELAGRSDGFVLDRVSIRSESFKNNTASFREPGPRSEQTPKLPTPLIDSIDLNQYPEMAVWSTAGVTGGIPRGIPNVRTIQPGDDIQSAIIDVDNQGGGGLLLSNGTYVVSDSITLRSNVIVRGEDRDATRVEFTYFGASSKSLFNFDNTDYAGVENLTMEYIAPGGLQPMTGVYNIPAERNDIFTNLVRFQSNAEDNWVKGCNILNAGTDPVVVDGFHNTMMDNYVEGAHHKNGDRVNGTSNLIKGEIIKAVRHFGILSRPRSRYNVIVDCFFETDINFHSGDDGYNLIEGNTVSLPRWHFWDLISTGGITFGHIPPGCENLVVNNITHHAGRSKQQGWSQENFVYTFEGYGPPLATDIPLPQGGRFYVPDSPQLTFVNPTPANRTILDEGSNIGVEIQANTGIDNMKLYRDGALVREEGTSPWQWGIGSQSDPLLMNLAAGIYTFRVEATLSSGGTLEETFRITVDNSADLNKTFYGAGSYSYSGTASISHTPRVESFDDGDWLLFDNLRIAGADAFTILASSGDDNRGGIIEIRTGSPTGPLLGTVVVGQTGGPDNYESFSTTIPSITGPVDIYLVGNGPGNKLYNIESFQFTTPTLTFINPTPPNSSLLNIGSSINIEVTPSVTVDNIKLYRNGVFIRQESFDPYEWGHITPDDALLQNLQEGSYTFQAIATLPDGSTFDDSFTITVNDSGQLDEIIQAENFDSQSGVQIVTGTKVGYIDNWDWIRFDSLDIAGANTFTASVSSNNSGGTIEVRTGSPTGTVLGSITFGNTGGWTSFEEHSISIQSLSSTTEIYLVFRGGSGSLFDIDSFKFGNLALNFISPTPTDGSILGLGAESEVSVQTSAGVESVSLFVNGLLVDQQSAPPYIWNKTHPNFPALPSGTNTFRAEATIPGGGTLEISSSITVVDMRGPETGFSLSEVEANPDQVELTWAIPGLRLERSTDLKTWTPVPGESPLTVDLAPNDTQCFFRLRTD